jgi:hypothetical protein
MAITKVMAAITIIIKCLSEEAYYESKKFNRLSSEKFRLNDEFLFDYNDKYLGKLCVDKTTEEYT